MTAVPPTLLVSRAAMALSLVLAAGRATGLDAQQFGTAQPAIERHTPPR